MKRSKQRRADSGFRLKRTLNMTRFSTGVVYSEVQKRDLNVTCSCISTITHSFVISRTSILQSQSWNPHTFVERIAGASKEFVDPLIRIRLLVYRCLMNSYRHMPRLLVFWISLYGPHTIYYTIDGQPLLGNPDNLYLNMRYRIKSTR